MKELELAIKGYQVEYNRLPFLTSQAHLEDERKHLESKSPLLEILMGLDIQRNPRRITFYEGTISNNGKQGGLVTIQGHQELRDQWGQVYRLFFDWNGDGKVPDPQRRNSSISAPIIIYSAGPDGDYETWADNITSWER